MKSALTTCRACGHEHVRVFYRVDRVPANDVLLMDSRAAALACPRGDIALAQCARCGFIQNQRFDRRLVQYSDRCEESQACSETFNRFARELADRIADRIAPACQTVLEIGCGKGDFLAALCGGRALRGIGVDPAYRPQADLEAACPNVRFVRDVIERHPALVEAADVIVCRHTLEHIPEARAFLEFLRARTRDGTRLFFEVPDARSILQRLAFWDIYYEHCSYFAEASLANTFALAGFRVEEIATGFDDQYLIIVARASARAEGAVRTPASAPIVKLCARFEAAVGGAIERWRRLFDEARERGRRVVLWGGGSKAVGLLTTLGAAHALDCIVDIHPRKQHTFLPGTGHAILAPEALARRPPDLIIVMNPVYEAEIRALLATLRLSPTLLCLQ